MKSKQELIARCRTITPDEIAQLRIGPKTPDGHALLNTWDAGHVGDDGVWRPEPAPTIQGRWRYVKDVGVCSVCAWPHVQPSTGVYKEPNGTVYELNIGGQESRLCRVCLENLIREVRRAEVGELVENLAILCDWVHICHDSDGGIRVSAKFGPHVFSCSATFLGQAVQQVFSQVNS